MTDVNTPTPAPAEEAARTVRTAADRIKGILSAKATAAETPPGTETPVETPPEEVTPFGQPPEEDTPSAPDEDTPPEPPVQRYKVTVEGKELEVDLPELKRGYSRLTDYTRKTQALAEERRSLESELSSAREERNQYNQGLEALRTQLAAVAEPDLSKLLNEDPLEFIRQDALSRNRKERLQAVEAEQRRVAELNKADNERKLQAYVREQQSRLLEALPDWRDAKKQSSEHAQLLAYGRALGWTDAELSQFYDHRAVLALREGMLYRQMRDQARKVTEASKGPKAATPGHLKPSIVNRELAAAQERFAKSHSPRDAAQVFKARMAASQLKR